MTGEPTTARPAHWANERRKHVAVALVMLRDMLPAVTSDLTGGQLTAERAEQVAKYLDRLAAQLRDCVPTVIDNSANDTS